MKSHNGNSNRKRNTVSNKNQTYTIDTGKVKVVDKRYLVTSQTAYHITQLALSQNTTEGRIIDKIMRSYLASLKTPYPMTKY